MTTPTFPTLRSNLAYPVKRVPYVDTTRIKAWSGRRGNFPHFAYPIYDFTIKFDYLSAAAANLDWQTLEGFWKTVAITPGQYFFFNFIEDMNAGPLQQFGTGDGSTTAFQLVRTLGGFTEKVYGPVTASLFATGWRGTNVPQFSTIRTNRALWSNDLTQAAWTKTNATALKNQVGPDGVSNNASALTATAINGQALQSITRSSAPHTFSVWLKRPSGSGTVQITMDGGSTWTSITANALWAKYTLTQTLANPSIGFRIPTNGDVLNVAYAQLESGAVATSSIQSGAAATSVIDYSLGPTGLVTFAAPPDAGGGGALTWTGTFNWLCQLGEDVANFENFMFQFWSLGELTFNSAVL